MPVSFFFFFFLPLLYLRCASSPPPTSTITSSAGAPTATYRAAISPTQYHRNSTTDFDMEANVEYMIQQIQLASTVYESQIIVFGETQVNFPYSVPTQCSWKLVLQTQAEYIPTINQNDNNSETIVPCLDPQWENRTIARRFSCAARKYGIYVAYNAYTSYPCNTDDFGPICPSGGFFVFNTIVVLDSLGGLVAKYYKRSVQTEAPGAVQPTPSILRLIPDNPTFTTSFGVTFGNLVCYDLVRGYPLSEYVRNDVRNILFPNAFDGLPGFWSHVGIAQGVARALNLNILCASAAGEGVSGGSAIVSGVKTLAVNYDPGTCVGEYYDQVPSEACFDLVVADVPVVPFESSSPSPSSSSSSPSSAYPPLSPEPYRCTTSRYLLDNIPPMMEPLLGLEANCVTGVVSAGTSASFFTSFGRVTCLANFTVSSSASPDLTTFTLRASEVTLWTPNSPCPFSFAVCYLSAETPQCTGYPSCPSDSYDSPLRFSDIRIVAHVPAEYTVIPLAMETGGSMSTDRYSFTVNTGSSGVGTSGEAIGEGMRGASIEYEEESLLSPTYEMAAQDELTVVFATLLGIYWNPDWPYDCISCYDPFRGPGKGEEASEFALESVRNEFRDFMCQQCLDIDGWKNQTNWPPQWAIPNKRINHPTKLERSPDPNPLIINNHTINI